MTDDERAAWLAGLKKGDDVFLEAGLASSISSVREVTPDILRAGLLWFSRQTGNSAGGGPTSIRPLTQKDLDAAEAGALIIRMSQFNGLSNLTLPQLRRIAAILDEPGAVDAGGKDGA